MVNAGASRLLPFAREPVFDVAADIERYPEFLPGWVSARIVSRAGQTCEVEQSLGMGPLNVHFASHAVLRRPERIDVTASEAPFRRFHLCWSIEAVAVDSCRASITTELELESAMLQALVGRALPTAMADVMAAFEARVRRLCAGTEPPR